MPRRPGFGWAAAVIVLTAWAGVAARGADGPPGEAPKAAEEAPKPAEETPQSPEAVLSARGLVRSGAGYVLKEQEDECFQKFEEVRPRYEKLAADYDKLAAIAMGEAQVGELQAEQAMLQRQIQALSSSGRTSSRYGGRYARYAQSPTAQLQQQLRAQQTVIAQQLAMVKQQAVPANKKQEANALYQKHRGELLASSDEVLALFEKVRKEYADVEAEPPVRAALGALRRAAKAQLKVAPSAEFNKKLARLKYLEKMMRPETISQAAPARGKGKTRRPARPTP